MPSFAIPLYLGTVKLRRMQNGSHQHEKAVPAGARDVDGRQVGDVIAVDALRVLEDRVCELLRRRAASHAVVPGTPGAGGHCTRQ